MSQPAPTAGGPNGNVIAFDSVRRRAGRRSERRSPVPSRPVGTPLEHLAESWTIHLEEANKSDKTIRSYTDTVRAFVRYLTQYDMPIDAEGVEADHVRKFLRTSQPVKRSLIAFDH